MLSWSRWVGRCFPPKFESLNSVTVTVVKVARKHCMATVQNVELLLRTRYTWGAYIEGWLGMKTEVRASHEFTLVLVEWFVKQNSLLRYI